MNKKEFMSELEIILDVDEDTLTGSEFLEELEDWDSLAVVSFIGMVDEKLGITLEVEKIVACQTIDHLVAIVSDYLEK
jgi:acyl carrier protein